MVEERRRKPPPDVVKPKLRFSVSIGDKPQDEGFPNQQQILSRMGAALLERLGSIAFSMR
jgi:hypothetical protein